LGDDDEEFVENKIDKFIKTQLERIMEKNTSNEIFRDYFVDPQDLHNTYRLVKFVKHKTKSNNKQILYQKIRLLLQMRIMKGILTVKVIILSI